MRPGRRNRPLRVLPVEITPMIDVVFLLIIFFMTTAQFAKMTRAEVNLPREPGEQQRAAEQAGVIVNVLRDGAIIIGDRTVAMDDMAAAVAEQMERSGPLGTSGKVLIRADRDADTQVLNGVVTRLRRMGLGAARLATEVPR